MALSCVSAFGCAESYIFKRPEGAHRVIVTGTHQTITVSGNGSAAAKAEVERLVREANSFFSSDLVIPSRVHLEVAAGNNDEPFALLHFGETPRIFVPYLNEAEVGGKAFTGVALHEHGHLLGTGTLEAIAAEKYPHLAALHEARVRAGELANKVRLGGLRAMALSEMLRGRVVIEEKIAVQQRIARMRQSKQTQINGWLREIDKIQEATHNAPLPMFVGYEELLADLVTVAKTGDEQAIYHALVRDGRACESYPATARDFTLGHKPEGWTEDDVHALLSPAASHVIERYFRDPRFAARKPYVIRQVAEAAAEDLNERFLDVSLQNIKPEDANVRLIAKIDARLRAH